MSGLFEELKRRNVFRVAIAYLVASWLLLQVIDVIGPILQFSDTVVRYLLFFLVIGFIPVLILAWVFEWTPDGMKLESEIDRTNSLTPHTGRKLDRVIIIILVLAVCFLLFDKLKPGPEPWLSKEDKLQNTVVTEPGAPVTEAQKKSVAVLPFVPMSNGPDDDYFSDGLTEEIINSLAQLPDLLVTARTSAFHFKGRNSTIADIAAQLGVNHVVEGSVRRAGEQLRITAQLIRTHDGFHLWSETYDRGTKDTFAVQEDIAEKIALALNVVLDEHLRGRMRRAGIQNVEAFTAYQKGRELLERAHGDDNLISLLRQANRYFEDTAALDPGIPEVYLQMTDLYDHILISQANGELDGNITEADILAAPANLAHNYDLAIRYAKNTGQRSAAEHDHALVVGDWNGLSALGERALASSRCETAYWIQLSTGAFGKAGPLRDVFLEMAACDPLLARNWNHITTSSLWLGDIPGAIEAAQAGMASVQSDWLTRNLVLALAAAGRADQATQLAKTHIRSERERLFVKSQVSALSGDDAASRGYLEAFLDQHGPNDFLSLVMEASRGNQSEANRLATLIDSRPFGYMSLLAAVYMCVCGAPFDLESAPNFASRLSTSGLPWPPAKPLDFPLKDW